MSIKITLGDQIFTDTQQPLELIPNIDRQPVDYCETCGNSKDTFWNGKQTICVSCDKSKAIRKKLGLPMVDEGLSLHEFFTRLHQRAESLGVG